MYNQFVNSFIDAQTESYRLYSEMAKAEAQLFGDTHTYRAVPVPTSKQVVAELRRVYETVISYIIERARRQFGAGNARFVLSRNEACKSAGVDVERALATGTVPDFDGLWAALEARFSAIGGGDR